MARGGGDAIAQRTPVGAVVLGGDRDGHGPAGLLHHAAQRGELGVEIAEVGDDLEHPAGAAHLRRDPHQLVSRRGQGGGRLAPAGPVVHRARGGESQGAGGDPLAHDAAHLLDLLAVRRLPPGPALPHHMEANGAVGNLGGQVDVERAPAQVVEVLGKAGPGPGQTLVESRARDVLHPLHQLDEPLAILRSAGGEAHAAVAHDDGCHAEPRRWRQPLVPRGLSVVVGVDVHEARHDEGTVCVDELSRAAVPTSAEGTDVHDATTFDGHVGRPGRCARSVDDGPAADQQVIVVAGHAAVSRTAGRVRLGQPRAPGSPLRWRTDVPCRQRQAQVGCSKRATLVSRPWRTTSRNW